VVKAVKVAKDMGLKTVGLTGGDGGDLAKIVDFALVVDSSATRDSGDTHYHWTRALRDGGPDAVPAAHLKTYAAEGNPSLVRGCL